MELAGHRSAYCLPSRRGAGGAGGAAARPLIGELTINAGGDAEAWRNFLLLLARPPEAVRAEGGIAHLWSTTAGTHVELREIDYAECSASGAAAIGQRGRTSSPAACRAMRRTESRRDEQDPAEIAGDETEPGNLSSSSKPGAEINHRREGQRDLRLLQAIIRAAKKANPEGVDPVLRNMAAAVGRLSPEMMVALLSRTDDATGDASGVVDAVVTRMTPQTIAGFIARNADSKGSSLDRVSQAFHTLVRPTISVSGCSRSRTARPRRRRSEARKDSRTLDRVAEK